MNRTIGARLGLARARAKAPATIALAAALALVVAGCGGDGGGGGGGGGGGASAPGVTDDEILLGTTQPLTGPAAPGYSKISAAMQAYFEFTNENGGVHGRTVELLVEDDGYNPSQTATKTRKLVLEDNVFAIVTALGTPTHTAVLDFLNQSQVPDLFVASGSRSWNQPEKYPFTFGWQPDYTVEAKILATYVEEKYPGKTLCAFGQGDDFGKDGVAGVETILGADALAANETYSPTNTNVAPQIGALQAAKCEVVFSFTVPGFTALAMGTAAKLGYAPQWVVTSVGSDVPTLRGLLKEAAGPLLEGMVSGAYLAFPDDTSDSWTALFAKVNEEYNDGVELDGNVLFGMAQAYTILQALDAAGEDLTRDSLIDAVQAGGFEGPAFAPFAFSEDNHSGISGTAISVVRNGKPVQDGPVWTTDDGDGPVEEYTQERPEAPEDGLPG